tara:strand:+ start:196 stop:354 length:159 start_codon:yes stop_codon:yes gene_type:complete
MEESVMFKELLSKNIIGIMGISITASIAVLAYQLMTTLFVQATLNVLNAMPH